MNNFRHIWGFFFIQHFIFYKKNTLRDFVTKLSIILNVLAEIFIYFILTSVNMNDNFSHYAMSFFQYLNMTLISSKAMFIFTNQGMSCLSCGGLYGSVYTNKKWTTFYSWFLYCILTQPSQVMRLSAQKRVFPATFLCACPKSETCSSLIVVGSFLSYLFFIICFVIK